MKKTKHDRLVEAAWWYFECKDLQEDNNSHATLYPELYPGIDAICDEAERVLRKLTPRAD